MANVGSSKKQEYNSELNEMQADYQFKRKDLTRKKEADLDNLRAAYQAQKEQIQEQGDAAINHLQKNIRKDNEDAVATKESLNEKNSANLRKMEEKYRQTAQEVRTRKQEQLEAARNEGKDKLENYSANTDKKIAEIRTKSQSQLTQAKEQYKKDISEYDKYTGDRVTSIRENSKKTIDHELEKGRTAQTKLRDNFQKDYDKTHNFGEQKIQTEKEQQDARLARLESDSKEKYSKKENNWSERDKDLQVNYSRKLSNDKETWEGNLEHQQKRFETTYQNRESRNQETLQIQNDKLTKELAHTKLDFVKSANKYSDKQDDPFYKIEDRGSYIRENSNFYVLRAYVPEHEKDLIKVNIQNNKATVSGQRAFKDAFADEDKKVSSSSYQSFREEFKFDVPVISEGMTREREGDWITFRIPKLNKFDRKA